MNKSKRGKKWRDFIATLNPEIDPKAVRLIEAVRMGAHMLYQLGEASLAQSGLSYAQYRILMSLLLAERIENKQQLNPSEISDKQGTSRNTISSLIRSLEEDGLIARHLDTKDRRKFNICLTEAGRKKVSQHASRHMAIVASCFTAFSEQEQDQLNQLMLKLSTNVEEARQSIGVK